MSFTSIIYGKIGNIDKLLVNVLFVYEPIVITIIEAVPMVSELVVTATAKDFKRRHEIGTEVLSRWNRRYLSVR